jgi:hypothetical protein
MINNYLKNIIENINYITMDAKAIVSTKKDFIGKL